MMTTTTTGRLNVEAARSARRGVTPIRGGPASRGRFPYGAVTLFAPDDYYLGTRKFMDLLTAGIETQRADLADRIAATAAVFRIRRKR